MLASRIRITHPPVNVSVCACGQGWWRYVWRRGVAMSGCVGECVCVRERGGGVCEYVCVYVWNGVHERRKEGDKLTIRDREDRGGGGGGKGRKGNEADKKRAAEEN